MTNPIDYEALCERLKKELKYLRRAHDATLCSVEALRLQRDDLHDEVERLRQAVLDEREACIEIVLSNFDIDDGYVFAVTDAIRAREEK